MTKDSIKQKEIQRDCSKKAFELLFKMKSNSLDIHEIELLAKKFKRSLQLKALDMGLDVEDALKFKNTFQLEAYKLTNDVLKSLLIKNSYQLHALKYKITKE